MDSYCYETSDLPLFINYFATASEPKKPKLLPSNSSKSSKNKVSAADNDSSPKAEESPPPSLTTSTAMNSKVEKPADRRESKERDEGEEGSKDTGEEGGGRCEMEKEGKDRKDEGQVVGKTETGESEEHVTMETEQAMDHSVIAQQET